jgi:hypothetical protein
MKKGFENTRKAVQELRQSGELDSLWNAARAATNEEFETAFNAYMEGVGRWTEKLQDAFYEDTKHINSSDKCRLMGIKRIVEIADSV